MTVLETENLTHYYENGMAGAVAAIENINVKFEKVSRTLPESGFRSPLRC